MRFVVTTAPEVEAVGREELLRAGISAFLESLAPGVQVVETALSPAQFEKRLENAVFLRHLAPAEAEVRLSGDSAEVLRCILQAASLFAERLNASCSFSVQTRFLNGETGLRKFDANRTLSDWLAERTGASLDTRSPEQVLSVFVAGGRALLGLSKSRHNRSYWPGGERRFKREDGLISRSEFKLLEAIEVFGLCFPHGGHALDLGAAPGGWSRVLRQQGLRVTAVDPSDLDSRLSGDPGIAHSRCRVQEFDAEPNRFAIIVNDLKMDARASASCMLRASRWLAPGGLAVMTLKLPVAIGKPRVVLSMIEVVLSQLSRKYQILGARHLFHNRSEVTVALRRLTDEFVSFSARRTGISS